MILRFIEKLTPASLSAKLMTVLGLILILNSAVSIFLLNLSMTWAMVETARQSTIPQITAAFKLIDRQSTKEGRQIAQALRGNLTDISITPTFDVHWHFEHEGMRPGPEVVSRVIREQIAKETGTSEADVHVAVRRGGFAVIRDFHWGLTPFVSVLETPVPDGNGLVDAPGEWLGVAIRLSDGNWLRIVSALPPTVRAFAWPTVVQFVLFGLLTLIAVALVVRRLSSPLRQMATTADRLGRGEPVKDLDTNYGPTEVRQVFKAFGRMQGRLERFIADRMRMIAAISHDLRTPLTSLRINAEFIENAENREHMIEQLDEMEEIVKSTLAFAKSEAEDEPIAAVDISDLLSAVAEEQRRIGQQVFVKHNPYSELRGRPVSLKRAFRNLIENAVKYGTRADVLIAERMNNLVVSIIDQGPGFDPELAGELVQPFARLEPSRNRETGGNGLGLSIANSIINRHGGTLTFERRPNGFVTDVSLPKQAN